MANSDQPRHRSSAGLAPTSSGAPASSPEWVESHNWPCRPKEWIVSREVRLGGLMSVGLIVLAGAARPHCMQLSHACVVGACCLGAAPHPGPCLLPVPPISKGCATQCVRQRASAGQNGRLLLVCCVCSGAAPGSAMPAAVQYTATCTWVGSCRRCCAVSSNGAPGGCRGAHTLSFCL